MQLDTKCEFSSLFSIFKETLESKTNNQSILQTLHREELLHLFSRICKTCSPNRVWLELVCYQDMAHERDWCLGGWEKEIFWETSCAPHMEVASFCLRWRGSFNKITQRVWSMILEFAEHRDCHLTHPLEVRRKGYVAGTSHVWEGTTVKCWPRRMLHFRWWVGNGECFPGSKCGPGNREAVCNHFIRDTNNNDYWD